MHSTGDDCISIQTGCSNVFVHNVNCGPGHGISIGSLGKDNTRACVSNVTVRDITMQDTLTGVRIKTWQVKAPYHSSSPFSSHLEGRRERGEKEGKKKNSSKDYRTTIN